MTVEKRPKVLIIDDEKLLHSAYKRLLRDHFDVVGVTSAEEGLELLESDKGIDAILCDLALEGMDGVVMYHTLKATRPNLAEKVIFITGGIQTMRVASFIQEIPNVVLFKPIEAEKLIDAIKKVGKNPIGG